MIIEVAVTQLPNAEEMRVGKPETLIIPWHTVVCANEQVALLLTGSANAEKLEKVTQFDQLAIKLRKS